MSLDVYSSNITHNLGKMAREAGIYDCLWRPDETGLTKAHQIIEPLCSGLEKLRAEPSKYAAYNPSNGWGDYEGLVAFAQEYLEACQKFPTANVSVWR